MIFSSLASRSPGSTKSSMSRWSLAPTRGTTEPPASSLRRAMRWASFAKLASGEAVSERRLCANPNNIFLVLPVALTRAPVKVWQNSVHRGSVAVLRSPMRATKRAVVQELVQRQQDCVLVLAVTLTEMPELDQPADFNIAQVQGDASQTITPTLPVSAHPSGAGGDTRYLFRIEWRSHLEMSAFTQNKL